MTSSTLRAVFAAVAILAALGLSACLVDWGVPHTLRRLALALVTGAQRAARLMVAGADRLDARRRTLDAAYREQLTRRAA